MTWGCAARSLPIAQRSAQQRFPNCCRSSSAAEGRRQARPAVDGPEASLPAAPHSRSFAGNGKRPTSSSSPRASTPISRGERGLAQLRSAKALVDDKAVQCRPTADIRCPKFVAAERPLTQWCGARGRNRPLPFDLGSRSRKDRMRTPARDRARRPVSRLPTPANVRHARAVAGLSGHAPSSRRVKRHDEAPESTGTGERADVQAEVRDLHRGA